jgi:hypothetical protein
LADYQAYINTSTTGTVTFNLPANPTTFTRVKFKHLTTLTNPTVINRNGSNIKGATNNVALINPGTEAEFVYINSTWGWEYVSNLSVRVGTSPTPLNFVSNRDTNGLFYHLGTRFNTVPWSNPQSASPECALYLSNQGNNGGFIAQTLTLTDRGYVNGHSFTTSGSGAVQPKMYINLNVGATKYFRLDRVSLSLITSGATQYPRTTLFLGSNDNIIYNTISGFNGFVDDAYNWYVLKSFVEDTSFDSLSGAAEANFIINSDNYYRNFKIVFLTSSGSTPSGGARNTNINFAEIEMYGDLLK